MFKLDEYIMEIFVFNICRKCTEMVYSSSCHAVEMFIEHIQIILNELNLYFP